jgi:putative Flp pilus-assembly TadE/G-like protein
MQRSTESGYVLVTVAVLLVVLLAFTALAVDIGMAFAARTQNQAAADSAALAGAFTFTDTSKAQPAAAVNEATKVAVANKTMGAAVVPGDVAVTPDLANHRVTVTITRTEPTFFSKVIGFNSVQVRTTAIAEAAPSAQGGPCMKPVFVPNSLGQMDLCGAMGACSDPNKQLIDAAGNKTAYATSLIGAQFTLKPQSPSGALNPSDFYLVDLGENGGGSAEMEAALGRCYDPATFLCQSSYPVLTGNKKGPTKTGINELIGGPPPDDTYVSVGHYRHLDGNVYDTSRALVSAPIVDLCGVSGFCPTGGLRPGGSQPPLRVVGFMQIFIESVGQGGSSQGDVVARFINVSGCAPGPPTAGGSTYNGWPIRLVRVP